jgi:hypothetical protein
LASDVNVNKKNQTINSKNKHRKLNRFQIKEHSNVTFIILVNFTVKKYTKDKVEKSASGMFKLFKTFNKKRGASRCEGERREIQRD